MKIQKIIPNYEVIELTKKQERKKKKEREGSDKEIKGEIEKE